MNDGFPFAGRLMSSRVLGAQCPFIGAWSSVLTAPRSHGCTVSRGYTEDRSHSGMSITRWRSLA